MATGAPTAPDVDIGKNYSASRVLTSSVRMITLFTMVSDTPYVSADVITLDDEGNFVLQDFNGGQDSDDSASIEAPEEDGRRSI